MCEPSAGPKLTSSRWLLAVSVSLVKLVGVDFIGFYETSARKQVVAETDQSLCRQIDQGRSILVTDLNRFRYNLSFLHATPPISGLTRADDVGSEFIRIKQLSLLQERQSQKQTT